MIKRFLLLLTGVVLSVASAFPQDISAEIADAFRKGDSRKLTQHLNTKAELIILGQAKELEKANVEKELTSFFLNNKVNDFTVNHEGKRDESSFIIGSLATDKGKYRVNCFFRKTRDKYLIHQIRIDKANE